MKKISLLAVMILSFNFFLLSVVTTEKYTVHIKKRNASVQQYDEKKINEMKEQKKMFLAERDRKDQLYLKVKADWMEEETSESKAVSISAIENSFNYKEDNSGELVFMGTVINQGSSSAVFVKIESEIYDSGNTKIGDGFTYIYGGSNVRLTSIGAYTNALYNGDIGYFKDYIDVPYDDVDTIVYTISYSTSSHTLANASLSITDGPYTSSSFGDLKLEGEITNSSSTYLTYFTQVCFCIYNSSDVVEDVSFTYVDGSTYKYGTGSSDTTDTALYPGETGGFEEWFIYCEYNDASTYLASFEFNEVYSGSTSKPTINLSTTSLNFTSYIQSEIMGSQSFTISNSGSGTLNWTVSENASWLSVSPNSGTNTGTVTASVDASSLSAGTYTTKITVSDPNATNSPQYVNVTLTVNQQLKPTIALSRTQLNFSASGNNVTDSQTFMVSNSGSGTLYWNASDNASWLTVTPASGTNTGTVTASIDASSLAPGTYNGAITVSDSNATNNPQTVNVLLKVYNQGGSATPFGEFSTPVSGTTVSSSIPVTGWALDDVGVQNVKIYRDDNGTHVYIGDAVFVEGARPDVAAAYPDYPNNFLAGWGYMLLTNFLPNKGNGTFTLYAKATDIEGNTVSLGSKTITCDNAHAVKPFGAIDTPTQGGTASGSSFVNWGWVLTPQPNSINTNGSTINVYVDGINKGHPHYNVYRADIATFFPGYVNSNGAVGYFYLNTTPYTNGIHTIGWVATDSGSNADGIGSRFFSIQNTSSMSGSNAAGLQLQVSPIDPINLENAPLSLEYVEVSKGYNETDNTEKTPHYAGSDGSITVEVEELERVVIHLFNRSNHGNPHNRSIVNTSTLPIGSTLDSKEGIFYWMPAAGFVGEYRFDFVEQWEDGSMTRKNIIIKIAPRFSIQNEDKTKSKL